MQVVSFVEREKRSNSSVDRHKSWCVTIMHLFFYFLFIIPAFTSYTELAVAAGQKLIIPVNADDFSSSVK